MQYRRRVSAAAGFLNFPENSMNAKGSKAKKGTTAARSTKSTVTEQGSDSQQSATKGAPSSAGSGSRQSAPTTGGKQSSSGSRQGKG